MRLSQELITKALEIYKIIESLKPPDELHQLIHCKKWSKWSIQPQHFHKKGQAQTVIPYYWPLEQRTNDANAYLLAMCYHVEFHDLINSDLETQVSLIIDSGALISISLHLEDFVTEIRASRSITLQGIGGGCEVEGIGTVTYRIPRPHKPDFTLQIHPIRTILSITSALPTAVAWTVSPQRTQQCKFHHTCTRCLSHAWGRMFQFSIPPQDKITNPNCIL